MRVAVTGAHGLTAGALVRVLAERGHDVVAVVRRGGPVPGACEIVTGDAADAGVLARALAGADALVHVAGIHLGERLAAADAVRTVPRLVVVSTAGVYSPHRTSAALYAHNEETLRAARPDATIVRPTMIYGSPRDRNVHRVITFARQWRVLPLPNGGRALIQPIDYADLAAAIASLVPVDAPGVVDAGGPAPISLETAAHTIFRVLGFAPRLVPVPVSVAISAARVVDGAAGSRWSERLERTREDRVVSNARLIELTQADLRPFEVGVREEVAAMSAVPS